MGQLNTEAILFLFLETLFRLNTAMIALRSVKPRASLQHTHALLTLSTIAIQIAISKGIAWGYENNLSMKC